MNLKWLIKHEPVIVGGFLIGVAVFFAVRYGTHAGAALQGTTGGLTASFVGLLSRWVGPSAMQDVTGVANDLAAFKQQVGPLPSKGGLVGISKWLADLAEQHGKNLEAIVGAAKTDIEDLLHSRPATPTVTADPPSTTAGTLTAVEPVQPPPAGNDAVAELAKLVGP